PPANAPAAPRIVRPASRARPSVTFLPSWVFCSDERNPAGVTAFRSALQKTHDGRKVTDGRARVAGRTIRGAAGAFAGGGLSDARFGSRSGRRRSGSLVTTQPLRRKWHRESRSLADDGRFAGVPGHASIAKVKSRGVAGYTQA